MHWPPAIVVRFSDHGLTFNLLLCVALRTDRLHARDLRRKLALHAGDGGGL